MPRVLLISRAASPADSSCSPNLLPPGRGWALLGQALIPVLAVSTSMCSRSQNTSPKTKQRALGLLGGCCWAAWGAEFSRTRGQGCCVLCQRGEMECCWGQFPSLSFVGGSDTSAAVPGWALWGARGQVDVVLFWEAPCTLLWVGTGDGGCPQG